MDEKRKALLKKIEETVIPFADENLATRGFDDYKVKNVFCYRKEIKLVNKQTKQMEKFKLYAVQTEKINAEEGQDSRFELECLEDETGNLYTIEALREKYEEKSFKDIGRVARHTQENEEKPEEEQDEELKKDTLEELKEEREKETEKEQETEQSKDKNKTVNKDEQKKRKPSRVIERVNPDRAKMDYWQTIKQACGLPENVHTLAFSYPVSSEDKVDYANITVYMLDKDGYIIDDLDIDDYFAFDSATGNNPMQDNVVRHEEERNKGDVQLAENRTMIRLYAKKSRDKNTYISLEQKNNFGDYNDINVGRKTVAGNENVEKQLETDRVRVWDSEEEKLLKSNAGMYNINDIFDEAEKHKEHGDQEYIKTKNADGINTTQEVCESPYVPDTEITWEQFSKIMGNNSVEDLQKEFYERYNGKNGQELLLRMQAEHKEKETSEPVEEKIVEDEYEGRVPWDSTKH